MTDQPNSNKVVDLVVYTPDGERKIVGQCEIDGDKLSAKITDPEVAKKLMGPIKVEDFSVSEGPVSHNVFDPEKKD